MNPMLRNRSCGCATPARSRRMREIAERTTPKSPRGTEPITLDGGPGAKCRPFLTVEKDAEKFAACNALAEEIGPLDEPKKVFRILEDAIGDEISEVFGVMTLDIHKRFKGMGITGRGESDSVMAPIKPTLRLAVASGGDYAILFHCHPSGVEAEPSDADIETTEAFADAFEAIDMILLDHIVTGGSIKDPSYFSFLEGGLL